VEQDHVKQRFHKLCYWDLSFPRGSTRNEANLDTVGLETDSQDNYVSKKSVNKAKRTSRDIFKIQNQHLYFIKKMMNIHSIEAPLPV